MTPQEQQDVTDRERLVRQLGVASGAALESLYFGQPTQILAELVAQLQYGRANGKLAAIKSYPAYVASKIKDGNQPWFAWWCERKAEQADASRPAARTNRTKSFDQLVARLTPTYWNRPPSFAQALRSCIDGDASQGVTYPDVDEDWLLALEAAEPQVDNAGATALGIELPMIGGETHEERAVRTSAALSQALRRHRPKEAKLIADFAVRFGLAQTGETQPWLAPHLTKSAP